MTTTTLTSNFTALINITNSAKNIREYSIANAAFAVLLDEVLDRNDIKIEYESQEDYSYNNTDQVDYLRSSIDEYSDFTINQLWTYRDDTSWHNMSTYYDLITISDGLRDVCIPVPLLKPRVALACFEDARQRRNFIQKREHNRSHSPKLPGQRDYLLNQLEKICPNWSDLTDKYLANKVETEEILGNYFLCNIFGYEEGLVKDVTSNIYRIDDDRRGHDTLGMHGGYYVSDSPSHSGDIQIIPILV